MGTTISQVYVNTYERNVRHLAQQSVNRLRPWVMERSVQGEAHNWERIAQTPYLGTAIEIKSSPGSMGRKVATPDSNTPWSRRISRPSTYHIGDVTETDDPTQMIVDPNSNYAMAHAMWMRRQYDRVIIAASKGTARDGEGNDVVFPPAQEVGSATTPFSFDLVTAVSEKFMDNNIDPDEPKAFVISPKVARKLLQLTEATSGDYNALRPLTSKGYVESWMGYTWIVSTLLTGTSGQRHCFALTRRALGLQVNSDISARIEQDPSISFAWRIYCKAQFGCVRVEDEHIVGAHVLETA